MRGEGELCRPISVFGSRGRDADVAPARWAMRGINFRRVPRVCSWNVSSLLEDHRILHLSEKLSKLRVDMVMHSFSCATLILSLAQREMAGDMCWYPWLWYQ